MGYFVVAVKDWPEIDLDIKVLLPHLLLRTFSLWLFLHDIWPASHPCGAPSLGIPPTRTDCQPGTFGNVWRSFDGRREGES